MTLRDHSKPGQFILRATLLFLLATAAPARGGVAFVASTARPPAVTRELRGAWVATVKNIDWPSRPGLGAPDQKAELIRILDRARRLNLNAIFLQVRPACDALYESALEPWSEYLTGTMGRSPGYDPLAFAVREAHRRGLELHAWMNPFRARHSTATGAVARTHISHTQPALVKSYGKSLWLDPGQQAVRDYSLRVILDVVRRYDIDGLHFDDYFYPYDEKDAKGRAIPFPDESSWKNYESSGGKLGREDWRRGNVNGFIQHVQTSVHSLKPWVKFGVSPFGIWRPGHPASIKGLDAYDKLFADSRRWFSEGWVDYLAPQLYWATSAPEQSFPVLLKWWSEQNLLHRHLWPGIAHRNGTAEVIQQIQSARKESLATGQIHWSIKALLNNQHGVGDALLAGPYSQPALPPAFPWLDSIPPAAPRLKVESDGRAGARASWIAGPGKAAGFWLLQSRSGGSWRSELLPPTQTYFACADADVVALTAIDRCGNSSPALVVERPSRASPTR
ncbi:MAG: hypothetical protein QOF48_481 [Verrucomicrobiota bacterium]